MTRCRDVATKLSRHLQVLLPEGLWNPGGEVVELPPPDDEDVATVLRRVLRQLRPRLAQVEGALPEDEYEELQAASMQGRLVLGDELRPLPRHRSSRARTSSGPAR